MKSIHSVPPVKPTMSSKITPATIDFKPFIKFYFNYSTIMKIYNKKLSWHYPLNVLMYIQQ
jgi:hypothetical protein